MVWPADGLEVGGLGGMVWGVVGLRNVFLLAGSPLAGSTDGRAAHGLASILPIT